MEAKRTLQTEWRAIAAKLKILYEKMVYRMDRVMEKTFTLGASVPCLELNMRLVV